MSINVMKHRRKTLNKLPPKNDLKRNIDKGTFLVWAVQIHVWIAGRSKIPYYSKSPIDSFSQSADDSNQGTV